MQKHNYYPFRTAISSSNGMFYSQEEIRKEMRENLQEGYYDQYELNVLDINKWQAANDFLSIFKPIKVPNFLIITCAN